MLMNIQYRGKQPITADEWEHVLQTIRIVAEVTMKLKHIKVGKQTSILNRLSCTSYRKSSSRALRILKKLSEAWSVINLMKLENSGWSGPPFDPRILASIMGIQCEESRKLVHSEDAELHSTSAGKISNQIQSR